jgi:hypothetical protein
MGEDEYTDYSVLDLYYNASRWKSRFVDTKNSKIKYSARLRYLYGSFMIATLSVPFANDWGSKNVVIYNRKDRLITDIELDSVVYTDSNPQAYIGNEPNWHQYMWGINLTELPKSNDGEIIFDVQLAWNKDGSPCAKSTNIYIETDAGYVPRSKITTDENGKSQFKIIPLGLSAGEKIKIKLGAATYSSIKSIEVIV